MKRAQSEAAGRACNVVPAFSIEASFDIRMILMNRSSLNDGGMQLLKVDLAADCMGIAEFEVVSIDRDRPSEESEVSRRDRW